MPTKTILVNFVTWPAVGHAVEGFRAALGYRQANPGCEIDLVLNRYTAVDLAAAAPWVRNTYTVDIPSPRSAVSPDLLRHIPRDWDYVTFDDRPSPNAYGVYRAQATDYFRARIATGRVGTPEIPFVHSHSRFRLPEDALARARSLVPDGGVHVALMPGGGNARHDVYPSLDSWCRIIEGLRARYPDLTIHLLGKLDPRGHPTVTATTRGDVETLLERYDFCRERFDIGLLNQLAVAQRCSVFVSPHTGFAFAVLCVGTPWLTISGGRWMEFFHVGTPFYSVLPNPARFPAFDAARHEETVTDPDGSERIPSMCAARVEEDLDEILAGAEILIGRRWTYERCLEHYLRRRARLYDPALRRWAVLYARPLKLRALRIAGAVRNS